MLTHQYPTNFKHGLHNDHDLTELSWLTRSNIFDQRSTNSSCPIPPKISETLPTYSIKKDELPRHHYVSPSSINDSSDSDHDNDSSSLNSSSERVTTSLSDVVSPPHSALCFWILFAIEDSRTRALTLNEICDWIERNIESQHPLKTSHPISSDEQLIRSARLKSKIRYHMTKQISFFVKIIKDPVNGIKLRYPIWTTDRSKRLLLLDTLLTMNTRQLSLYTQYTINIYERLCSERRLALSSRNTNDENSCPTSLKDKVKRDKTIHRLGSADESTTNNKRKKHRTKTESSTTSTPSVEVVDAAMTLLLLRKPK